MKKCNECKYQENLNNKLICQHIQSMLGLEAIEEYKLCEDINECDYFYNKECNECTQKIDCITAMEHNFCPSFRKDSFMNIHKKGEL